MRMNNRAEGSFAETMVAMMIATIALSSFMAVFVYSLQLNEEPESPISCDFLDGVAIEDGSFTGIDPQYIEEECVRRNYSSMIVNLETAGDVNKITLRLGEGNDSDFTYVKGTLNVPCDDGSTVVVNYEVVAFA